MENGSDDRSLGSLVGDLAQQVSELVKQEVQLARAEVSAQVGRITGGVRALAIGAAFTFGGLTLMLVAAVIGLAVVVPAWLAALFIGLLAANIGSLLLLRGWRLLGAVDLTPKRALRTMTKRVERGGEGSRRVA